MAKRVIRSLSVGVVILIAGLSVIGTVAMRRVVAADQHKLLSERGEQVTAILENTFQQEITSARVLGAVALADRVDAQRTLAAGSKSLLEQGVETFGIAHKTRHGFVVLARVGTGPGPGAVISGRDGALLRKGSKSVAGMTALVDEGSKSRISLYLAFGNDVVYLYSAVTPTTPIPPVFGPFASLRGAVYASATPSAASLVMTTERQLPLTGQTGVETFMVGDDVWSLVYGVRGPLVDSWSANLPWLILGAGLGLALLVAAIIAMLGRRQSYANNLVAERTRSLTEANEELQRAEEAADRANRSKSEFLSRMSHELRTPLNAVLGYAQILQMDPLREDQEQPVAQILASGRHLLELINEVLDISRIEVGKLTLSVEPVGIAEVIDTALDMVRPRADESHISLIVGEGIEGTTVQADRQRLRQILLNLLTNAVKYNHEGGSVTLACNVSADRTTARISVTDTGPGISAENHERVFAPFERLGMAQADVEGTGIGLALSRHLADAMNGSMGVTSKLGSGSTFWVDLPLAASLEPDVVEPADVPDQRRPEASCTVLQVEDNPANVKLIERALSRLGDVRVMTATSGRDALEIARSTAISLVLLDVHLPDLTGEQVLRAMRDHPATAEVPIVVVSADATEGQISRLLAAGATAYLTKPIEISELLDIVASTTAVSSR
ncbi:MAG TPA: ATP-binding protein [Mycobacteriales bacterium]|nr:ATP-binding protein [Mycobacteriales bacterium]